MSSLIYKENATWPNLKDSKTKDQSCNSAFKRWMHSQFIPQARRLPKHNWLQPLDKKRLASPTLPKTIVFNFNQKHTSPSLKCPIQWAKKLTMVRPWTEWAHLILISSFSTHLIFASSFSTHLILISPFSTHLILISSFSTHLILISSFSTHLILASSLSTHLILGSSFSTQLILISSFSTHLQ